MPKIELITAKLAVALLFVASLAGAESLEALNRQCQWGYGDHADVLHVNRAIVGQWQTERGDRWIFRPLGELLIVVSGEAARVAYMYDGSRLVLLWDDGDGHALCLELTAELLGGGVDLVVRGLGDPLRFRRR